jgi:two-component system, chemotaxis family, protein-glutamate methylesterase/glutaminase
MSRPRTVVAMAASAGGIQALSTVLGGLPRELPAAVAIVQHLDRHHPSVLAELLGRRSALEVRQAGDGVELREGEVVVAPPDHHLLVNPDGSCSLTTTDLVHFVRPSADLLFESCAGAFGTSAIAVVLSGMGIDGSLGIAAVKERGGFVIAQDAAAEFGGMPAAAIATGIVDRILPLDDIAAAIAEAVRVGTGR